MFTAALFILLCSATLVSAAPVTIRLASLVPENTDWGRALNKMAQQWSEATNGEVIVKVYHGGVISSNESEILQKLNQNQIQAAVLSSAGMSKISEKILTLSCPFLIRNDEELDYILADLKPTLESQIDRNGYKVVAWSKAGWIKFFGRRPIFTPPDLRSQKIASGEVPALNNAFKALGYTITVMAYNDVRTALEANRIDAFFQSPVYAASMQLFNTARNMCSLNVAPFMGGIVLNQAAWRRIPDKYKAKLLEISGQVEIDNNNAIAALERSAIDIMLKNGLVINEVSPAQQKLWEDESNAAMSSLSNGGSAAIDPEIYQRIETLLRQIRK
jgi:TRAP-type C4-dicarboxylate transport system substrate-binding protein